MLCGLVRESSVPDGAAVSNNIHDLSFIGVMLFCLGGKPNNDTRESDGERTNQNQSFAPAYRGAHMNYHFMGTTQLDPTPQ